MRIGKVAARAGLKPSTASTILRRWKLVGHNINYKSTNKKGRKSKFNIMQEAYIINAKTLRQMAHLHKETKRF